MKPGTINWRGFEQGTKYRVHTITGLQKKTREHVMVFLGLKLKDFPDQINRTSTWSARPFAGTQELRDTDIVAVYQVDDQETECYMNRVLDSGTRLV